MTNNPAGASFYNPAGTYAGTYAATAIAIHAAVRRDAAVTQLMTLLPQREALDAALAEARRRAEVFLGVMTSNSTVTADPYAAGLESVIADVQKGLL